MLTRRNAQPIKIRPADYRIYRQVPGQWQLEILWRFKNQTNVPLYILIALPRITRIAEPLILDHSSLGSVWQLEGNIDRGFRFLTLPPSEVVERWLIYNLPFPDLLKHTTVVGRFGFGDSSPNPAWENDKAWVQVAAWQKIADSESLLVIFTP